MRKLIVTGVVAALVAGALVAPAEAGKKKRVAEGSYTNPAIGIPGVVGSPAAGGAFEFPVMSNEKFVSIDITDDFGGDVTATLSQNTDTSNTTWEIFAVICGRTAEPLAIAPGITMRVSVYTTPGRGQLTCTGPATSGTIKATFSSKP